MRRIVTIAIIIFCCFSFFNTEAQEKAPKKRVKSDFVDRLRFGGYLGVQFGTLTAVELSPMVTYVAKDWLYPGVGFTYMYFRDNRPDPAYTNSYYGPRLFTSVFLWRDLYAHAEYEALNIGFSDRPGTREFIHSIMLGGGYRQWLGNRAFVMVTILYNFNESIYSPYSNPIFRIGFGVGI